MDNAARVLRLICFSICELQYHLCIIIVPVCLHVFENQMARLYSPDTLHSVEQITAMALVLQYLEHGL